ncbi:MAG: peptidyl-prolyl cis-trans isomerase [Chitinispirillales bacterium]|jgi:hypothetical protein|nr:peptidyl-prolyl cis-trans isomerase [Chitinispirillales bacterium]
MDINKKTECRRRSVLRAATLPCVVSALLFTIIAASCQHEEIQKRPEGPIVARVGNDYLTLAELKESIPPEYSDVITRDQNVLYVRQWINTEILYQEAIRLGIDQEPVIKARLERMRKDLLSTELMSRSASASNVEISEQAIREYYESNREQFVREYNVVRYEDIVVPDVNVAFEIRRTVTHESFKNVAKTHSKSPEGVSENAPYVVLDAIPPKLRNAIITTTVLPAIIGPYGAEDGFHVMRVTGKYDKGTIASIDEVRDEIISRLSSITQKGETERLISEIRARSDVEFNVDLIPGVGAVTPETSKQDTVKQDTPKPTTAAAATAAPRPTVTPITPRPAPTAPRPAVPPAPTPAPAPAAEE